jgi:hypothetical protein
MALITGLAGVLGRFAGRFVNSTLGWATILLFGKVPQSRQSLLLLLVLASLGWVAALLGVLFPDIGAVLITFVPAPDFIDESWIRLAMLVAAIALPLLVGVMALFITEKQNRPRGLGIVTTIIRGYPFTFVLTVTIAILAVVALYRKVRSMSRRWQDAHVPMVVKPGGYEALLAQLHEVLGGAGFELAVRPAPKILAAPPKLLDAVAGRALGALVPDQLMLLQSRSLEVLMYPSDLAISGIKGEVARARAAIVSTLTHAPAYQTTSAESQRFEDRLTQIDEAARDRPLERVTRVRELDSELARLVVPFEEWETLYRERLQLERNALRDAGVQAPVERARTVEHADARPSRMDVAVGVAGLGLVALDLALVLVERRRGRGSG